ncbi:hypothetical protein Tco_1262307 [Tanacetum coccineum]
MAGSEDDIPPPPPPPPSQTPTQQTPHTVSTIKLPILKNGEYDIWAMKMEHYLAHTDYPIWEVIQRGNGPVSVSTDTNEIWEAVKSRFCGNDELKKMQKYILKQQFEGFSVSNSEGLHKGYDRFQSLLSQLEIHGVDSLSFDDLYNNLRVFESDVKGSTTSSSSTQNVTFVSENTSRHFARECKSKGNQDSRRRDARNTRNKDKENRRRSGKHEDSKALVTLDGEGVDYTSHSEDEQENYALMACSNAGLDTGEVEQLGDC